MNVERVNIAEIVSDKVTYSFSNKFGFRSKLSAPYLQLFFDIITFTIGYLIYYFVLFKSGLFSLSFEPEFLDIIKIILCFNIYWFLIFWFSGLYKDWYVRSPFDELFTLIRTAFIGTFIIFFFVFLDSSKSPRLAFLIYFAIFIIMVGSGRLIARNLQKKLRAKRIIVIPTIIVGTAKEVKDLHDKTFTAKSWGYQPIGVVLLNDNEVEHWHKFELHQGEKAPVLGLIENLKEVLKKTNPQEVLIAVEHPEHNLLLNITTLCAENKISIKIVPDLYDFFTGQAKTLHLYGIPLIDISTQILKPWQYITKRVMDIIFSSLILLIGLPLWGLIALIIKLESKGYVFYKQERTGKHETTFLMYKFRSMVEDAEKHGPQWAKVNDARVTGFGRFLRKSHLDEIPQFINVLMGDMSIVGPRPERPVFVDKFSQLVPYYKRRLVLRPGITGWWQVKYTTYVESKEEIENRLKDDFYYIENMSLRLDFEILMRTIILMIKGHGQT